MPHKEAQDIFAFLMLLALEGVGFESDLFNAPERNPGDLIYLYNLENLELLHLAAHFLMKNVYDFVTARLSLASKPDREMP